jgi:large conductance mechanosensitive channel
VKFDLFPTAGIKFIIIALILFCIIKAFKSMDHKKVPAGTKPSATEKVLAEIRDELKK